MLSQLTTIGLDTTEELHTAADGIFTRKVFFVNGDGEGMSIQMMRAHNEVVVASRKSHSPEVVYLMYALITCQSWWLVSRCAGHDAQLKLGMSARHLYMYLRQQHGRVCVCVCVCACMCTQEYFRFLTARGKWWKAVAHLAAALCSLCATSGSLARKPAEAESQLEVCT